MAFQSFFQFFFFPLQKQALSSARCPGSSWYCCTLENAVHGVLRKQTVLLYFSPGEGKRPKVWRVLRGPCEHSQPHRTMSKALWLPGISWAISPPRGFLNLEKPVANKRQTVRSKSQPLASSSIQTNFKC